MSTNNFTTTNRLLKDDGQGLGSGGALQLFQGAGKILRMTATFFLELLKVKAASNLNRLLLTVAMFFGFAAWVSYSGAPFWILVVVYCFFFVSASILVLVFIRLFFTKGGFDSDHVALVKAAKYEGKWEGSKIDSDSF